MLSFQFTSDALPASQQPAATAVHRSGRSRVSGAYDAAQTTRENQNHWSMTDALSANAAHDPSTRAIIRERARYEAANNGYAKGMIETLSNDLVGTGPRVQLSIPGVDRERIAAVESAFASWSLVSDFPEDLRLLHATQLRDGEAFGLLINNPLLLRSGRTRVALDLAVYEPEQVDDPWYRSYDPLYVDGIRRDAAGNPLSYTFLRQHPGGVASYLSYETEVYDADQVVHWYRPFRAGQARGVSTLVPTLNLFAQLRRYTLATLTAAEFAATLAGVLKTPAMMAGESEADTTPEAMDAVNMVRGALLTLPEGTDAVQFKPEQPTATYQSFKAELLKEIGRGSQMPAAIIQGSSENYNFSSARLDQLLYHRMIRVDRSRMRRKVLDPVFCAWAAEAILAGSIPGDLPPLDQWSWEWHWDGFDSIDPQKDAQTDEIELRLGTTTLQAIYARKGLDWESQLRQRARERQLIAELDAAAPVSPAASAPAAPETPQSTEEEQRNAA